MQMYLKNLFSNKERHALEKQVMQDPFETEAFEGLAELSAEAFETDIQKLQSQLTKRTKKRKGLLWQRPYAIAASVLFLMGLGVLFFMLNTNTKPYQIVTNYEEIEDAVVVNESSQEKEKENKDEDLFLTPDFSSKEDSEVAYEEVEDIEENIPVQVKTQKPIEKTVFSKKTNPTMPKKTTVAAAEVVEETEEEVVEREPISAIVEQQQETKPIADELPKLETWSGTITDNYGMPLPGVNVIAKDGSVGTVTDFDGNYTIKVPKDAQLEANYLGFENTEIVYDSHKKVIMDEDIAALEEVVVVGYATRKQRKVTGAIQQVKGKELPRESSVRVDEALAGRVAGVKISSAEVGAEIQIDKPAIAPQGSDDAFKQWVMTQLNPTKFETGKEYNIEINYIIDEKGKLSDVEILTDLKASEKRHVKGVLLSSLNWTPAQKNNGTIKQSKSLVLWFHF